MTTIRLYLGAHKTATTHVQGILIANRELLQERGVLLTAPRDLRKDWLPRFFDAQQTLMQTGRIPEALARPLRALMPERGDWILTDENIIGIPVELARQPGIYPHAGRRIATLRALYPEVRMELHFSVRSYDSFYRSMYSEVVRNRGFMPFAKFFDPVRHARNSWVAFVEDIAREMPAEDIVLWRFEDFRGVQAQVLRGLSGQEDVDSLIAAYGTEVTRPSLSQKTVDILADLAPAIGTAEALRLTEIINRHYAVADGHAPLEVFDAATTARYRQQYVDDMATIAARFPGLRVLRPEPAATATPA
jgi:hypothetical protein